MPYRETVENISYYINKGVFLVLYFLSVYIYTVGKLCFGVVYFPNTHFEFWPENLCASFCSIFVSERYLKNKLDRGLVLHFEFCHWKWFLSLLLSSVIILVVKIKRTLFIQITAAIIKQQIHGGSSYCRRTVQYFFFF